VGRVQSMHIRKIILKMELTDSVNATRQLLQSVVTQVQSQPIANSLRVYFDVDPV
jgi:primosomal protein N' (replication factor Y)